MDDQTTGLAGASHLDYLQQVADEDVQQLLAKERDYQGSWKRRGGVGAFMMLARKWDRIEAQVSRNYPQVEPSNEPTPAWDIFAHALHDSRTEGLLDDIGDLRRYLLLVEAEIRRRREHGGT